MVCAEKVIGQRLRISLWLIGKDAYKKYAAHGFDKLKVIVVAAKLRVGAFAFDARPAVMMRRILRG